MFAAITGGGTAGHVLPAIAVAEALVAAGHAADTIHYIGSARGIETRLLPETGFGGTYVDVVGFQRRLDRRNFAFVPKMVTATRSIIDLFERDRPSVVVSVGGYASMPAVFAARRLGIPVVVVSYDRTPGRASRLAARSAAACAVAFEGSLLPRAEVTGAPVRQSILDVDRSRDRDEARVLLSVDPRRFMVTVMGGSLGSGVLNDAIARYVRDHVDDADLTVLQIAGERFAARIAQVGGSQPGVEHRVVAYEFDMAAVYAATDLLVGRGGASTVHEVAVTGTPAILVPWAHAADDHQTANVSWLSQSGGAQLIAEAQLSTLGDEIERLRRSRPARDALSDAARALGEVHRSGALAGLIERVAVTSPPS
jgi:UDP-N-acetylglucosamine--N-acetylmuramyl-(pentapeptide) pyrophosphoryl-undecaprenol N-acetylglucosamine transferase